MVEVARSSSPETAPSSSDLVLLFEGPNLASTVMFIFTLAKERL